MDCMQAPSQQTSTQGNCTVVARVCGHGLMLCTSLSLGSPPAGTLPPEWGYPKEGHESQYPSAFPSLARLAIEGNNISGAAKNSAASGQAGLSFAILSQACAIRLCLPRGDVQVVEHLAAH